MDYIATYRAARRVSVPLLVLVTSDPASTIRKLVEASDPTTTFVSWDIIQGWHEPVAKFKYGIAAQLAGTADPSKYNPIGFVEKAVDVPSGCVVFAHALDAHYLGGDANSATVVQGLWNLRDRFKADRRMLVVLARRGQLPVELKHDVIVVEEPLPAGDELIDVVERVKKFAQKADGNKFVASDAVIEDAAGRVSGLSAFAAEQAAALSITRNGFDLNSMLDRKRTMISETPGLSVWSGKERFADIGGCKNIKKFAGRVIGGRRKTQTFVFIDEIEKALAGSGGDTSGVSQDQLMAVLTEMQNKSMRGMMFVGHPGAAKSCLAKAIGNEAGGLTIEFDLGGMKGSLVGQSEERIREAFRVVEAVSGGGNAIVIATCNKIAALPSELQRRFNLGTFFFDLPDAEERDAIWKIYLAKNPEAKGKRPNDACWTGAEIRACVENAADQGVSLIEASEYITPVARAAPEAIEALRKAADGRYISASNPGLYSRENARENVRSIQVG